MDTHGVTVWTDEQIQAGVLSIIRNARKHVILVTPYLVLWRHAKDAIELARANGVQITCLVRNQEDQISSEDTAWLLDKKVRVLAVDRLHAKIFLNEEHIVVGSMNLTEPSINENKEIAFHIANDAIEKEIRGYVHDRLMKQGKPLNPVSVAQDWEPVPGHQTGVQRKGACIRCHRQIGLDPGKPLCNECYEKWAEWENPDYEEKYCHVCGRQWQTSYARPLCASCFRKF
jgi:phosphatidylserine/phosphatidylglycerophosphate/cardiolipin synthase-like enzyme